MKRITNQLKHTKALYDFFRLVENSVNNMLFKASVLYQRQHGTIINPRQRILISKLDAIGDFVIFSSSLPIYRKLFPSAHLTLLVRSDVYNLAEHCPHVDEVLSINQRFFRYSFTEHIKWFRFLRSNRFDIAINAVYSANFDFFDCLIGWTAASRRIGFENKDGGVNRRSIQYYTELICDNSIGPLFEVDRNTTMLSHLGYLAHPTPQTQIWVTEEDRITITNLLEQHGVHKYAIIFPGARDSYRSWGVVNFTEFAQIISTKLRITLIIAGGTDDIELCKELENNLLNIGVNCHNFSAKTTLRQLACLIDSADFCISSETSAAHISIAVSTPCFCIIGGGHYGRFYPYPGNPLAQHVTNQLPCFGCNWICTRTSMECVSGITVEDAVTSLFSGLLNESAKKQ